MELSNWLNLVDGQHKRPAKKEPNQTDGTIAKCERDAILLALCQTDGNRGQAAEILGIGERTLYRRLREYHINQPRQRKASPPKPSLIRLVKSIWAGIWATFK